MLMKLLHLYIKLPLSDLSTALSKKVKTPSLSQFFSSLAYIFHLGYRRTDVSGIDQASLFYLILISLSFAVFIQAIVSLYSTCSLICNYGVTLAVLFVYPVTTKDTCIYIFSLFLNCYYFMYLEVLNKYKK